MGELFDSWTRDQDGNPVIWNRPPYRGPGGRLSLLLVGEHKDVLADPVVHHKRISEYYLLEKRDHLKLVHKRKAPNDPE